MKPMLSVFIAGGIDGLLNMVFVIVFGISSSIGSSNAFLYVTQFIIAPIQLCQSMSHALTYGIYSKKIRKWLFDHSCCNTTKARLLS